MPQMTPSQARIVDPLVTELALAYRNTAFIAHELFPVVPVGARAGKVPKFNRDNFKRVTNGAYHAPGAHIPQVQVNYGAESFGLVDRILHGKVPRELEEEANAVPGIQLRAQALTLIQDLLATELEVKAAGLALNAANYPTANKVTLAGADRWTDPASDPLGDIQAAKSAVRHSIGAEPNKLVLSNAAFYALQRHPKIQQTINPTQTAKPVTIEYLQSYFEIDRVIVGKSIVMNDDDTVDDIWGVDAWLGWVPNAGTFLTPSFGYTYRLRGYPFAGQTYWQEETHSWLVPWTVVEDPHLTGVDSGFLFVNAGDAT